ncbi:hypothetical protein VTK56DRAFT_8070 [Thermocarpiscus australiensis]
MPIRNPFARRPGAIAIQDENRRPGSAAGNGDAAHPGFERVDTVGSKASSAFSIRSRKSQDTGEYKMSVVNDSGVYLPPSPIEKEATWPRRYLSRTSSEKSSGSEIEHFPISRESFDSYRRSFDICAKSPVAIADPVPPRQSLDSNRLPRHHHHSPRSPLSEQYYHGHRRFGLEREPPTPEESVFEDVGLHDDNSDRSQQSQSQSQAPPPPPPKRRGFFFAKFASDATTSSPPPGTAADNNSNNNNNNQNGTAMSRFLPVVGRKRAQSGQGAELGVLPGRVGVGVDELEKASAATVPVPATSLRPQEVES